MKCRRCIGNVTVREIKWEQEVQKEEIMHLAKVSKFLGRFARNFGWRNLCWLKLTKKANLPAKLSRLRNSHRKTHNLRERLIFWLPVFFFCCRSGAGVQDLLIKWEALKFIDFYGARNISLSKRSIDAPSNCFTFIESLSRPGTKNLRELIKGTTWGRWKKNNPYVVCERITIFEVVRP